MPFRLISLLSAILLSASMPLSARGETDRGRPLTLEDMLNVEGVGAALFDPDGRWLVYEKIPPYADLGDYSFGLYAFGRSGHQLWKQDLASDAGPERLAGLPEDGFSFLGSVSPDGTYLSVYLYRQGSLSLGIYDMETDTYRPASLTPALGRAGEYVPVWISRMELAFVALPDGVQPWVSSVRTFAGRIRSQGWRAAWRGDQVTALEVSSGIGGDLAASEPGSLVLMNAASGEQRLLGDGLHVDLRPSPDGRYLSALQVFTAPEFTGDLLQAPDRRRYGLRIYDLKSGAAQAPAPRFNAAPLTQVWHPGSGQIAVFGWTEGAGPEEGAFYRFGADGGVPERYDHSRLEFVSERERGWRQRPERAAFLGDDLAVLARSLPESEGGPGRFTYQDISPEGLSRKDWYALGTGTLPRNLTSGLESGAGTLIHAGNGRFAIGNEDGAFLLMPDAAPRRITPDLPGVLDYALPGTLAARSGVARPEFTRDVAVARRHAGQTEISVIDFFPSTGPVATPISTLPGRAVTVLASSSRSRQALARADEGNGSVLGLTTGRSSELPRQLARLNRHVDGIDPGRWVRVPYPAGSGELASRQIVSCVLLPPEHSPAAPPPLVVEVYPGKGPACQEGPGQVSGVDPHSPYIWAGYGFAFVRVSAPTDLIRTADGPIAGMPALVEAGIDALVAEGYADPGRVVLTGFSQGGVSALYVAANSDRFGAVIAKNSWADLFFHYFEPAGIYALIEDDALGAQFARYESHKGSDFSMGHSPFSAPALYRQNSPLFLAPGIEAPVLLIHSDLDSFGMVQFDAMYAALHRLGKSVSYVRYLGEGHGPSSPANIRHMWGRKLDFLEQSGIYMPAPLARDPERPVHVRSQLSMPQ